MSKLQEKASIDWNNYLTPEEVQKFLSKDDKVESAEEIVYNTKGNFYNKYFKDFKEQGWTKRELTQDLANFYHNGHLIEESKEDIISQINEITNKCIEAGLKDKLKEYTIPCMRDYQLKFNPTADNRVTPWLYLVKELKDNKDTISWELQEFADTFIKEANKCYEENNKLQESSNNKITLYHNTTNENALKINEEGIKTGVRNNVYGEGNEAEGNGIWCRNIRTYGNGGATITFEINEDDEALYKANDNEYIIYRDIKPEEIKDIDLVVSTVKTKGHSIMESDIPNLINLYGKKKVLDILRSRPNSFVEPYTFKYITKLLDTGEKYCKGNIQLVENKSKIQEYNFEDYNTKIEQYKNQQLQDFINKLRINFPKCKISEPIHSKYSGDRIKITHKNLIITIILMELLETESGQPEYAINYDGHQNYIGVADDVIQFIKDYIEQDYMLTENNKLEETKETDVLQIAKQIRQKYVDEKYPGIGLSGCCIPASDELSKKLVELGYNAKTIDGYAIFDNTEQSEINYDNHSMVEVIIDGTKYYLDITCEQFENYIDECEEGKIIFQQDLPYWFSLEKPKIEKFTEKLSLVRNKLQEASRNELLTKAKMQTKTRYAKSAGYKGFTIEDVDTDHLLTLDTLPITCRVGKYWCTVELQDVLYWIQYEAEKNKDNQVNSHAIIEAILKAVDAMDIKVNCTCADSQYRFNYYLTQINAKYGKPENRPAKITNPHNYGSLCKHLISMLSNKKWMQQVGAPIMDWMEKRIDNVNKFLRVKYGEELTLPNELARKNAKLGQYAKIFDKIEQEEEKEKENG